MTFTKYIVLFVSIAGALILLGVRLSSHEQSLQFEGPSFMQLSPDRSTLTILTGNQFVDVGEYGHIESTLSMTGLGMRVQGSFAYFPNGDILLYHYGAKTSFISTLAKLVRLRDSEDKAALNDEGFYRCNKYQKTCDRWAQSLPPLGEHAFGMTIDQSSGNVYISATAKFIIYKLNEAGELLAKNDVDLRFPNVVKLHNNQLYIADTNNHRIKVVSTETYNFGEQIAQHPVSINSNYRWPVSIEVAGSNWFVMVNDTDMYLSRLLKFDRDWLAFEEVELPSHAWLIGMAYYDEALWVSDMENYALYRFDRNGNRLGNFSSSQWESINQHSKSERRRLQAMANNALIAMIVCFALGLGIAYAIEKRA